VPRRATSILGVATGCVLLVSGFLACGSRTEIDVPMPVSGRQDGQAPRHDAGEDAGEDAARDTGFDAGSDASDGAFDVILDGPEEAAKDAPDDVVPPSDASDGGMRCAGGGAPTAYLLDENGDIYTFDPAGVSVQFLGTPVCNDDSGPFTLSVSREGKAFILYSDWQIFEVDLATFECSATPFQLGQLGLSSGLAIAVSRAASVETLLVSGVSDTSGVPILASSNLTSFVLAKVGDIVPAPPAGTFPIDTQADLSGHLFGLSDDGLLLEMNVNSGAVESTAEVPLNPDSSWAIMAYDASVFAFSGSTVLEYDAMTHASAEIGDVGIEVIGASAVPCTAGP